MIGVSADAIANAPVDAAAPVELLATGRFVELRKRGRWEYAARVGNRGAAFILAVTDADEIVLVEQYRVPVQSSVIELPAGIVGDHPDDAEEGAKAAAVRELEEETGYRSHDIRHLQHGPTAPGLSAECLDLFLATKLERVGSGGGVDEDEDITVHVVAINEVPAWLRQMEARGCLVDPRVYAGLWFAAHPNA